MNADASSTDTFVQGFPMTMPNSPSYAIFPAYAAGRRISSPGPAAQLAGFIRKSGYFGTAFPSLIASAWKLFQRAMILLGEHGHRSVTADSASSLPLGACVAYMSPAYS